MEEVILRKKKGPAGLCWVARCSACRTLNYIDLVEDWAGEPGGMEWLGFDCECGTHLHLNPPLA